ncbi:MAG: hypothetical protein LUH02_03010 [Erysipelotrichaceae bacterium]|nr:hypothetical protein [Erysipelotrichaceae bacterium]
MLVVLKDNIQPIDIDRLMDIVRKYDVECIHSYCFDLSENISFNDLELLQNDIAVDKIVMNDMISVENMVKTYGFINE